MSEDLSAIHEKTCAIFEKLHNEKGQEMNDAFIEEYFKLVKEQLSDIVGEDTESDSEVSTFAPHGTVARFSAPGKNLTEVVVTSKNEKFLISNIKSVKDLTGTSQRFGSDRGKGTYVMTDVKGVPNITINSGKAVVTYVGVPYKVQAESGKGEWVKV